MPYVIYEFIRGSSLELSNAFSGLHMEDSPHEERNVVLEVRIPLSLHTALCLQISFLGAFPTTKPEVKL